MNRPESGKRIPVHPDLWCEYSGEGEGVRLLGMRCPECAEIDFPKKPRCLYCQNEDVEDYALKNQGTVTACSVVTRKPEKFYRGPVPFALGYVELADELRVWTPLISSDPEVFKPGMRVELILQDLYQNEDGDTVVGFGFTPSEETLR